MAARAVLLILLIGLAGSRWDGQPIVAKTLASTVHFTGDTSLIVEVVRGVIPADLLGRTMIYGSPETKRYWTARILRAEWSGQHIKLMLSPTDGPAPEVGEGTIIF
ncbi:MAG: hypothetical protein O6700_02620 [Gammaproteobacteria bacterium]|nr:hypothetical protein [Gammaproteobacteria bacterium]